MMRWDHSAVQSLYLRDVRPWTEACIYAPRTAILANQLRVEIRIHLDEQPRPASLSLQVESIWRAFSVEGTTLHKEAMTLP